MFFDSWTSILRTVATAVIVYGALIVILRSSGKRTLAKMNAFDLVVTVALGSTLSTILVSGEVPLADGLVALALLVLLQFGVAWLSVRWPAFEDLVKSSPSLLVYRGEMRRGEMHRQRVSEQEIHAAARRAGIARLGDAGAIVLETDGTFSVIRCDALPEPGDAAGSTLAETR